MSKEDRIKRLKAEKNDLRDAIDKAQQLGNVKGIKRPINNLIEKIRASIDRRTVKIEKLREEIKERQGASKPHVVLTRISPNQSVRSTSIQGIVLHSTESDNIESSANDLAGVASWFANPNSQVSAHVIVDSDGHSAVCVDPQKKAWHCAAFNSPLLGIENIGRAASNAWNNKEYDEAARWVAKWCKQFNIPLQRGEVNGSTVTKKGIFTHSQLGVAGGNHGDPGTYYDVGIVIEKARRYL